MPNVAEIGPPEPDQLPRATYRLQFSHRFTLSDAQYLVPYLHDLGISHIYASPLLKAVPGSSHGYDVCNFQELNPELGTSEDFGGLHEALKQHHMGLILDVVPNHMGINGPDNLWWRDVLANGPSSQFARCFDIDWQAADARLIGKVTLPILAERYHESLAHGSVRLAETGGWPCLKCGAQDLPVSPETVQALLRRASTAGCSSICDGIGQINGNLTALDALIQRQNYLLISGRNGDAMLNYRRFFTITSLAGIRIEDEWVFDQVFFLVKQWLEKGWVDGLRVDHPDGLREPKQFLQRLRSIAPEASIVVEKILEPGEPLDPSWPVEGTTGYDFLNNVLGLFIDPLAEKPLSDFYTEFTGDTGDFPAAVHAKKHTVIHDQLASEASRLTELLVQISSRHWECRDFTRAELQEAWTEMAACLPVYRTYASAADDDTEIGRHDARLIRAMAAAARTNRQDLPQELFDFLEELLLLRRRGAIETDFVLRFQQLTGPVMAKAVEDTAFYCYGRFVALNEVGGDPPRFGLSVLAFHQWCRRQQTLWPGSMAATSTHDTKRGADVRTRLAVITEMPGEWIEAVRQWSKWNENKRRQNWPDKKAEYLFYQTLVGAWPLSLERAQAYMLKAAREAKEHTNWDRPVPEYENALRDFIARAFAQSSFIAAVEKFVSRLSERGGINSLAQTLVKLTATGVPDIYQGTELWDLTLADPDNRQPVDFILRQKLLTLAKTLSADEAGRDASSGLANLWLCWSVLNTRRAHPHFFARSSAYEPLAVEGLHAASVVAFMRGEGAITVVPRLAARVHGNWADTAVDLPPGRWRNALTHAPVEGGRMAELVARFPVALLLRQT